MGHVEIGVEGGRREGHVGPVAHEGDDEGEDQPVLESVVAPVPLGQVSPQSQEEEEGRKELGGLGDGGLGIDRRGDRKEAEDRKEDAEDDDGEEGRREIDRHLFDFLRLLLCLLCFF